MSHHNDLDGARAHPEISTRVEEIPVEPVEHNACTINIENNSAAYNVQDSRNRSSYDNNDISDTDSVKSLAEKPQSSDDESFISEFEETIANCGSRYQTRTYTDSD